MRPGHDSANMSKRPRLPDPVEKKLVEIQDERDINTMGEAIRFVMVEAGYDV